MSMFHRFTIVTEDLDLGERLRVAARDNLEIHIFDQTFRIEHIKWNSTMGNGKKIEADLVAPPSASAVAKEVCQEVRTWHVTMPCDDCRIGTMQFMGGILASNPPLYRHRCDKCYVTARYSKKYPHERKELVGDRTKP